MKPVYGLLISKSWIFLVTQHGLPWEKNLGSLRLQLHLTLPFFFSQITIEKLIQTLLHGTYKALEASSFFWSLQNFYGFLRSYMGPKSNLHPDTEISSMVLLTAKSSILRYIIWWYTVTAHCSNPLAKIFLAHNVLAEIRFESCPFLPPLFRKLWDTR